MSRSSEPAPLLPPPEHPWERNRRAAFERWEREVRRTPYGHPLPDVVGFAFPVTTPPKGRTHASVRRLFAISALPAGPGPAHWAAVPPRRPVPPAGGLVRIPRPVKAVLPSPASPWGELLLDARHGTVPAGWEEVLSGIAPASVGDLVPRLSELWSLPSPAIEALLLPLVGSTPWHGNPAGLELNFEVEGWSLRRHREFLQRLLHLFPQWVWKPQRSVPAVPDVAPVAGGPSRPKQVRAFRPFAVELRPASGSPAAPVVGGSGSRSTIRYGSLLRSEFLASIQAGALTALLSAEEAERVPVRLPEAPDAIRATVWALHWWTPEPPDGPDWNRWLREEEPRLRSALEELPPSAPGASARERDAVLGRREFRDRLIQIAIARARVRAAPEVEPSDLRWAVDSFSSAIRRAVTLAPKGRGPLSRELDRSEGARTSRLRKALEFLLRNHASGISVAEAAAALGSPASEWEIENQLERLRIRGVLFQDRSGRYRLVG